MDNYQFAKAVEDKKHVDVEGDGEGDVLLLLLKEEEQEKQKDGGESLTMPADVASMKRKRGDVEDQDVGGDDDDEAEAEDKDDEDDESDVDDDDDDAEVHFYPSEEEDESVQKYYEQLNKSEGFDFDEFPAVPYLDMPLESVIRVHIEYQVNREVVTRLAEAAVTYYNDEHNTSYLFHSLEKANSLAFGELFTYYITFKGENITSDGEAVSPETFQAEVEEEFGVDDHPVVRVNFCRLKRT